MRVHNFYTDLLLSMRYLFDNIVFGPGTIKHYMFNVGSKTFQLEYESQYELPSCIINYQSSSAVHHHPWLIKRTLLNNHSLFPILYNKTKDLILELQEEEHDIQIEVLINFDSQFLGMEYEHKLKTALPIGKPLQMYHFYTFYEIPEEYLHPLMFDVNYHDIVNLYTKYDYIADKIIHCASVRYEPLLRLDSCQINIGSIDQRSFQLQSQITIQQSIPMYMQIPGHHYPIKKEPEIIKELGVVIPTNPDIPIIELIFKDSDEYRKLAIPINSKNKKIKNKFIYNDISDDSSSIICDISGSFSDDYVEYGIFKPTNILNDEVAISEYEFDNKILKLKGVLEGSFKYFNKLDDEINGFFIGQFDHKDINEELSGSYTKISNSYNLEHPLDINFPPNNEHSYETRLLPYSIPQKCLRKINFNTIEFSPQDSKLVGISILDENNDSYYYSFSKIVKLDNYGNFTSSFNYNNICLSIVGKLHPKTMDLNYDLIEYDSSSICHDSTSIITSLHFDIGCKTIPVFGERIIKNIDLTIVGDTYDPIMVGSNISFIKDEFDRDLNESDKLKLCSMVIVPNIYSEDNTNVFEELENCILFKIQFDDKFDIYNMLNHHQSYWLFFYNNITYTNSCKHIKYNGVNNKNQLIFKLDKIFYYNTFYNYSTTNPIIFQIFRQV